MKAVALFSGGLDSVLAIKLILEQGIEVIAVNFVTPFFSVQNREKLKKIAIDLGVELETVDIKDEYLEVLKSPRYGYGKNFNPCVDCRMLMFKEAEKLLNSKKASFIISGEVLGQRPMSQRKNVFGLMEKTSNLKGLILRPLSAKLLPLTIPEKENWINKEKLLDICGRSRKIQIDLARKWNLENYFSTAGGCLLTEVVFSRRMKDLLKYQEFCWDSINLLKIGRHFRLSSQAKLVVGRDEQENNLLIKSAKKDRVCFEPIEVKGPIGIGEGDFDDSLISLAAQIIARYCDQKQGAMKINHRLFAKREQIEVEAIDDNQIEKFRI